MEALKISYVNPETALRKNANEEYGGVNSICVVVCVSVDVTCLCEIFAGLGALHAAGNHIFESSTTTCACFIVLFIAAAAIGGSLVCIAGLGFSAPLLSRSLDTGATCCVRVTRDDERTMAGKQSFGLARVPTFAARSC